MIIQGLYLTRHERKGRAMYMNITFVDENDEIISYGSRETAIKDGIIHRIVRVLVFNSNGEILLQKRSEKVHVPNKWDQSAAGHVDEGEDYTMAAKRELEEEMGIVAPELVDVLKFYA
jgi:isopentenyldiphosphate isomerase